MNDLVPHREILVQIYGAHDRNAHRMARAAALPPCAPWPNPGVLCLAPVVACGCAAELSPVTTASFACSVPLSGFTAAWVAAVSTICTGTACSVPERSTK